MPRPIAGVAGVLAIAIGIAIALADRPAPMPAAPVAPLVTPSATPDASVPAATTAAATPTPTPTLGPIADGYRIQIPRLLIDLPIAEGDIEQDVVRQQTPENFAFHLPGTGIPGGGSNSYLYAHARRGMFLSLWNARVGDQVIISTPGGGALRYVITEVHPRVPPRDTSWIQPTTSERLTLQTSTGPNPEDPRFVVVAAPV